MGAEHEHAMRVLLLRQPPVQTPDRSLVDVTNCVAIIDVDPRRNGIGTSHQCVISSSKLPVKVSGLMRRGYPKKPSGIGNLRWPPQRRGWPSGMRR